MNFIEQFQKNSLMKPTECQDLCPEDKRLFNILEIKMYDLSQNVEILSKQLTNNQIKDIVSQSYSISHQLRQIYEHCKVPFLYNLQKKMQINSVLICSILTDRLEKQNATEATSKSQASTQKYIVEKNQPTKKSEVEELNDFKVPILGGVNLYNQTYKRGIQSMDTIVKDCPLKGTKTKLLNRKCTEEFITAVWQEIESKAEVEVESINDQIKNFITNFKQTSKAQSLFSCENELQDIIDFFKLSELQAINFLNKSPNNNKQYTEDYINRLNDMEKELKTKQSQQKNALLEKINEFIAKLKEKVAQIEKVYQQKNAKLIEYQAKLRKVTVSEGTQTYDNYQRRIKELQNRILEQEERYNILNQIRQAEHNFQSQIHSLRQVIQLKANENRKIAQAKLELEEELQGLKKLIREKNQRLSSKLQTQKRKNKIKQMLLKEGETVQSVLGDNEKQAFQNRAQRQLKSINSDHQKLKASRKTNKYEKTANYTSSSGGFRSSLDPQKLKMYDLSQAELEEILPPQPEEAVATSKAPEALTLKLTESEVKIPLQSKESAFKIQFKRMNSNVKKASQEENKQVSFMMTGSLHKVNSEYSKIQSAAAQHQDKPKQKSSEYSRSMISIDQDGDMSRRSNKKNTLRQKIDPVVSSMKELESEQNRKSAKNMSKKCIILKESKEKNIITTMLKLTKFGINQQFNLHFKPSNQKLKEQRVLQEKLKRLQQLEQLQATGNIKSKNTEKKVKINKISSKSKKYLQSKKQIKKDKYNMSQNVSTASPNKSINSIKEIQEREKDIKSKQNISLKRLEKLQHGKIYKNPNEKSLQMPSISRNEQSVQLDYHNKQNEANQMAILLKGLQRKSKKSYPSLKQPSNSKIENDFRRIASYLQIIKEEGGVVDMQLFKDSFNNSVDQTYSKLNIIREQIQRQDLNVDQFQEMLKIISYGQYQKVLDQKQTVKVIVEEPVPKPKPKVINEGHQFNIKKKESIRKESKDSVITPKEIQNSLGLTHYQIQKIGTLHRQLSGCNQIHIGGKYCNHIQKYLSIINKINSFSSNKTKVALKLPVQKIGQIDYEKIKEQRPSFLTSGGQKNNENQNLKQKGEHSFKLGKNSEADSLNYLRTNFNTEDGGDDKQRILPIINSTASSYYKAKSKVVR